ncbi:hypothetical protein MRS76_01480 [Rhizobiaceae bacterium n13]|uniref:Uncharacterized protein n=1 Tax=Ferirhizobium litorale TaxID=2927786 RepID=A0AAE3Q7T1_9HYPH|nr:hypothetical protein [Fererhizobium litorale]MDI7860614.1 hypothetical protein [Fererhizobium litorale]MDI7920762.1 hypothetical protein [Fererhizobium litorale]
MSDLTPSSFIELIGPSETVDVYFRKSPFAHERSPIKVFAGESVAEIIEQCSAVGGVDADRYRLHLTINGHAIQREYYHRARVKAGATVNAFAVPAKNGMRSILGLVVAVASLFFAGPLAAQLGLIACTTAFKVGALELLAIRNKLLRGHFRRWVEE